MALTLPVVWSDEHRRHVPDGEVWVGVRIPGTELPERAERIRAALVAAGAPVVAADAQPDAAVHAVHDPALTEYLAGAWAAWSASGFPEEPGQDRVVPYVFPHGSAPARAPRAIHARAGLFAYDTMTLIGPGTWEAARAAVDVAVTAAALAADGAHRLRALPPARPSRHADDVRRLLLPQQRRGRRGGCGSRRGETVAVIDIDAHHGNGTQGIFYDEPAVLTGSVHVDPGAGWFPHFTGFADETGAGGEGNRNVCLPPGAGDEAWLAAVRDLAAWAGDARALVVALGWTPRPGIPRRRCR